MTLTQTAAITKRALLGFFALIFISVTAFLGYQIYRIYFYRPPVKIILPETSFGALPKIQFPEATSSAKVYDFHLDTETGNLPGNFPKIVKVFFVPQLGTTLLAPQKIQQLSTDLGFPNGPDITDQTQYHFTDNNGGKLTVDLNSGNFSYDRPATDSALLITLPMANQDQIATDFKNYLSIKGLLKQSLVKVRSSITYNGSILTNSTQADITIWPEDLEGLPIVTPNPKKGLITATVTKAPQENYKYTKMNYTFWAPDPQNASTYPVKTVTQAFEDLKNDSGYISIPPDKNPVSITNVYLAYLETPDYSPYIQPVYVFEGPLFSAYVPAITSQYTKN